MTCVSLASHPAGRLNVLHGKNFNVGHYMQTFQPDVCTPAMLIGTVDYYYFIPLSLTLSLLGGHKVNAMRNILASFSCTFFNSLGWNLLGYWSNPSWTSWYHMLACIWTFRNWFGSSNQSWCDDRYYWILHFDTSLIDSNLDSRSKKVKTYEAIFWQSFQWIWMEFDTVRLLNIIPIYLIHSVFKGENHTLILFKKKILKTPKKPTLMLAFIQTFADWFLSNLVWWQRLLRSTIWYQFGWP